jgi:hypothetical protein
MVVKKNLALVLLCLTPAALLVLFSIYSDDCLDEKSAAALFDQASQLERQGNLKDAYLKYKIVDVTACENYEFSERAFNRAVAIKEVLDGP